MNGMNMDPLAMMTRWGNAAPTVGAPDLAQQLAMPEINMLQNLQSAPVAGAPGVTDPTFMQSMLGYRTPDGGQMAGWGGMAVGAASGLMNGFLGLKQLGIAKDSLAQSKKQFDMNWGAQTKLTNSRLEDRQAARVAAGGAAYQSVGDYMKKNGIGG